MASNTTKSEGFILVREESWNIEKYFKKGIRSILTVL
jgi:hypothetical protein